MNNSQNYIAEKSVFLSKNVADSNGISENEQKIEDRERYIRHRPSEAFRIFYESTISPNVSRIERNFKTVKKKRVRDGANREVSEDRKRIRKNSKKTQPDNISVTNSEKPSVIPITKSQSTRPKAEKTNQELPKIDKCSHFSISSNFNEIGEAKTETKKAHSDNEYAYYMVNQTTEKKPDLSRNPKQGSFTANPNISPKHSVKSANKSSIKPTVSEIEKRRINEILKSHAQKIIKEKISQIKENQKVLKEEPTECDLKEEVEIIRTELEPQKEAKNEIEKNPNIEEKNSKIAEKGSKESRGSKDSKGEGEEKKTLPSAWANVPQSNELGRRLKNFSRDYMFFGRKVQKPEHKNEEKKQKNSNVDNDQKGKSKSAFSGDDQKEKHKSEENEKGDEKKNEKRETYTDRLLLLKMIGKDLEDRKKAIEVNEELQRVTNVEKKANEKRAITPRKITHPLSRGLFQNNLLKPAVSKEIIIHEKKEQNPIKVEKIFESETVIKTKLTRSAELRDMVAQAIKDHKIFCIFDNHTYIVRPVREELLNRGWLEIIPDRRLIPRRRPPPAGPTFDRPPDKAPADRNCNTLEAILTAKQNFVDEIQETVSRSPSFKYAIDKPKIIATATNTTKKKISQESIQEIKSQFCILPPDSIKKKTNVDIRDFVAKYNAILERVKERENELKKLKEKEKNAKNQKKDKPRATTQRNKMEERSPTPDDYVKPPLSTKKSIQKIAESIRDNNKMLISVVTEIDNFEEKAGGNVAIGVLYENTHKNLPSIKQKEGEENPNKDKAPPSGNNQCKNVFTESEARTISKIIQSANARIHFMWLSIKPGIHLKCFNYSPEIINKFQRTTFCTKIGLWSHLSNIQWYAHEVSYPAKSPRMYNTGEADDLQAFFQDFQMTACIGMLKWISDTFFEKGLKGVHAKKGKVPLKAFEFAIKQCEKYMRFKENEDLTAYEDFNVLEDEWNTFLQWFYNITNDHGKVQESSTAQLMYVYTRAAETLKLMKRYWPEIDIDGRLNIWIMKPYCASCGRGIFMTNNVYYIGQHSKYIVQKYIEKPLLIYNTKFDIRQWFMITKLTPLEIWMYKECYLRFCTQPFVLRNLHESVHLSNNSVQRKYTGPRDPTLPDQNMWDSKTFQLYLRTIGQPSVWDEIIYPGMRDAIVSTMLSAQETFDGPRKSWFEVYGADFMLSSNLKDGPWLIEINENPAMDPSTKVTARLCPQMLRDVIKVVVDKRANKTASTGQWELVYRQNYSPSYGIVNLDVRGKKIAKNVNANKPNPDYTYSKPFQHEKKSPEDSTHNKLYEFVNNFPKVQNASANSNCIEKFRSRKKVIQNRKAHEAERSTKTEQLLKKFEKQANDASWGLNKIKGRGIKSEENEEKEVKVFRIDYTKKSPKLHKKQIDRSFFDRQIEESKQLLVQEKAKQENMSKKENAFEIISSLFK